MKYKRSLEISPEVKVLVKRISEAEILKNTAKKQESDCRSIKTKGNSKNLSVYKKCSSRYFRQFILRGAFKNINIMNMDKFA